MKCEIEKEKKKFVPVTLTIETEKEFRVLWNILNKNLNTNVDDYLGCGRHKEKHSMENLKSEVWNLLDEINREELKLNTIAMCYDE